MKLFRVILPVNFIDEASKYYSELFGLEGKRVSEGRHYFDLGGVILACYDPEADGDELAGGWKLHDQQYMYISTSEIEEVYERCKKIGFTHLDELIAEMPWGEKVFYMHDLFGHRWCFVQAGTEFTG